MKRRNPFTHEEKGYIYREKLKGRTFTEQASELHRGMIVVRKW